MEIYIVILAICLTVNAVDKIIGLEKSNKTECEDLMCPMSWMPICGKRFDGYQTFGNMCDLRRINCFAKPAYTYVGRGRCEDTVLNTEHKIVQASEPFANRKWINKGKK